MKTSLEELLKIAERPEPKKTASTLKDTVQQFINVLKIKEGMHRVNNAIVYKAYRMYVGGKPSAREFYSNFAKYVTPRTVSSSRGRHYMLNYRPIELLNKVDNLKIQIK